MLKANVSSTDLVKKSYSPKFFLVIELFYCLRFFSCFVIDNLRVFAYDLAIDKAQRLPIGAVRTWLQKEFFGSARLKVIEMWAPNLKRIWTPHISRLFLCFPSG